MNGDNIHNTQGERMTICEIIVFVAILVVALMVLWPRPHEAQPVNRGGIVQERNSAVIVGPIVGWRP